MKKTKYFLQVQNCMGILIEITKREFERQTNLLVRQIEQVTDYDNKNYDKPTYQQFYYRNGGICKYKHRFVNGVHSVVFIEIIDTRGKND